ncbi:ABC transporter substrate-binding protein [Muricoccus radiodurans]|uniref:ABC transporter substrate-binding protein n=1 Tax=Muricoccus radiodurans TaxID=2231721 RepID=UPI003CF20F56
MGTRYRIERRSLLTGGTALALVPFGASRPRAQALDRVIFQTDWRAQAEHGGYYQALSNGIYRRHGIECDLRQGGPQQNPAQLLLAGRVDMIMSNAFQALNYAREGLPFLCIGAVFQKDPQILMAHEGAGHDSFEQMRGKPIMIGAATRVTSWPFLRRRFGYTDDQIRPYTFNIQPFVANRLAIQQGFVTSEPYTAMTAGARPKVHLIADAGFDGYSETIDISARMIAERRDVVQRFINATIEGWVQYMAGRDTEPANARIKRDNPEMDDDRIDFAVREMNARGIVRSGAAETLGLLAMTEAKWTSFYETMRDSGVYPPGLDFRRAYSLDFVNKRVGVG